MLLPLQGSTNLFIWALVRVFQSHIHLESILLITLFVSLKLSSDAVHGDRSGEADEAAEAVRIKDSVFGLSDTKRPKGAELYFDHALWTIYYFTT